MYPTVWLYYTWYKTIVVLTQKTTTCSICLGWFHKTSAIMCQTFSYGTYYYDTFWRMGHSRMVRTLDTTVGGGVTCEVWSPCSNMEFSTRSNSSIIDIYSAASASRHGLMYPPYKNKRRASRKCCYAIDQINCICTVQIYILQRPTYGSLMASYFKLCS